jgi:hypothetical protein
MSISYAILITDVTRTAWEAFVCDACDSQIDELPVWDLQRRYREELKKGGHNVYHKLIRLFPKDWSETGEAGELKENEDKEAPVKERLARLEKQLGDSVSQLDTRLGSIEKMLSILLGAIPASFAPMDSSGSSQSQAVPTLAPILNGAPNYKRSSK